MGEEMGEAMGAAMGAANQSARIGRRPGPDNTRADLVTAARQLFAELGYDKASIRLIAKQAKVDPALVYHFFGSKDELLKATLQLPVDPDVIFADLDDSDPEIGSALLRRVLQAWSVPLLREQFVAMLRTGVSNDHATTTLRETLTTQLLSRVAQRLHAPDADFRAGLVATQMAGLAMARFIVGVDPIRDASDEVLIAAIGPTLTRYLVGDIGSQ